MDERQIRERLAKIQSLFAGATTSGERQAAQAAMERLQQHLSFEPAAGADAAIEYRFALDNPWSLRLFLALCRSKAFKPYRYPRMRRTSVCVRLTRRQVDQELWPEFQEMDAVLSQYLGELADHIIAECINPDRSDAETVAGLPGTDGGPEMKA